MKEKDAIKIRSSLQKEISTNIVINGKKYLILTEDIDPDKRLISTKVYLGGKILLTRNTDFKAVRDAPHAGEKIANLIRRQHKMIAQMLKKFHGKKAMTPSKYLDEVKYLLQKKENRAALALLTYALEQYPNEPFLLSYFGCLDAIVNKNYSNGIETCLMAIDMLDQKTPFGQEIFYPTFYLNLGRAYLAAKSKKEAVEAFQKGLSFDRENRDLLWEIRKLGVRRKPPIPYLRRTNPINKYIGMLLHKIKNS